MWWAEAGKYQVLPLDDRAPSRRSGAVLVPGFVDIHGCRSSALALCLRRITVAAGSQQRSDQLAADPPTEPRVRPAPLADEEVPELDGVVGPEDVAGLVLRDAVAEEPAVTEVRREGSHAGQALDL